MSATARSFPGNFQIVPHIDSWIIGKRILEAQGIHMNFSGTFVCPPLAEIVNANAKLCCCNPEFVLGPLLTAAASLLHKETKVQLTPMWEEPPILWVHIAARSGMRKSVALNAIRQALKNVDLEETNATSNVQPSVPYIHEEIGNVWVALMEQNRSVVALYKDCQIFYEMLGSRNAIANNIASKLFSGNSFIRFTKKNEEQRIGEPYFNIGGCISPDFLVTTMNTPFQLDGFMDRTLVFAPKSVFYSFKEMKANDDALPPGQPTITQIFRKIFDQHPTPITYVFSDDADNVFGEFVNYRNSILQQTDQEINDILAHDPEYSLDINYSAFNSAIRGIYDHCESQVARLAMVLQAINNAVYELWPEKFTKLGVDGKGYESVSIKNVLSLDESKVTILSATMTCAVNLVKHCIEIKKALVNAQSIPFANKREVKDERREEFRDNSLSSEVRPFRRSKVSKASNRTRAKGLSYQLTQTWDQLTRTKGSKVSKLCLKPGKCFTYRYLMQMRMVPANETKLTYKVVDEFLMKMVEHGFGTISRGHQSQSNWVYSKKSYDEMDASTKGYLQQLVIDKETYEENFIETGGVIG